MKMSSIVVGRRYVSLMYQFDEVSVEFHLEVFRFKVTRFPDRASVPVKIQPFKCECVLREQMVKMRRSLSCCYARVDGT